MVAKVRERVAPFQVADPVQHELDAVRCIGLERVSERFPHSAERWRVLTQVKNEQDAEDGLRPAEELWHEAFLLCHRGECDWPFEAALARFVRLTV